MNFHIKSNKKWRPLSIFTWAAVFMVLGTLGVYGWTADKPVDAPVAEEDPLEEAFELGSLLKDSIARQDTGSISPSPVYPDGVLPKTMTPAATEPFALPEDFMAEEVSAVEYPPLEPPANRGALVGADNFLIAERDLTGEFAEEILPVTATPVVLGDLDRLEKMGEVEPLDMLPEALPLESIQLEKTPIAPPVLAETEAPKSAAVKVPRLKKRSSANAKANRSRPTVGADPYHARPYYTPYVPTTGPGVLVTPR